MSRSGARRPAARYPELAEPDLAGTQGRRFGLVPPRRLACGHAGSIGAGPGACEKVKGKTPKVALVAVGRKLLVIANAVIREGRAWDPKLATAA